MSLDDDIRGLVRSITERSVFNLTKRLEREMLRPSTRLRPMLERIDVHSAGPFPSGAKMYLYLSPEDNDPSRGWHPAKRHYDSIVVNCWRASLHGLVAYGLTPEAAYDEFDHLFRNVEPP